MENKKSKKINEVNEIHYVTVTVDERVYKKGFYNRSWLIQSEQHIATIIHHHTLEKNDSMNTH